MIVRNVFPLNSGCLIVEALKPVLVYLSGNGDAVVVKYLFLNPLTPF